MRVRVPPWAPVKNKLRLLFILLLGIILLSVALLRANLSEVVLLLRQLDFLDGGILLVIFFTSSLGEAGSWLFTLRQAPFNFSWVVKLWRLSAIAATLEFTTPLGLFGGEPLKAVLLKRRHGISYQEAVASLVLTRTTDALAVVLFVGLALALTIWRGLLPQPWLGLASTILALFTLAVLTFVFLQQLGLVSKLERKWGGKSSSRLFRAVQSLHNVENHLELFYKSERLRFLLSIGLTLGEWLLGATTVWLSAAFLGAQITIPQAIVIEASMLLVTSTLFFIPGHIGSQEWGFVLAAEIMLGSAGLGLALAAIRRSRDIVWALLGLALVSFGQTKSKTSARDA